MTDVYLCERENRDQAVSLLTFYIITLQYCTITRSLLSARPLVDYYGS